MSRLLIYPVLAGVIFLFLLLVPSVQDEVFRFLSPLRGQPPGEPLPRPGLIAADDLTSTDVLPHTGGRIVAGRNYVYCASLQLAWNELMDDVQGSPVELQGSPELASVLNRRGFRESDLSPDSYVAAAGLVEEGIVSRIRRELAEKFPDSGVAIGEPSPLTRVIAYAYLEKLLPFETPFLPHDTTAFHLRDGRMVWTQSFGFLDSRNACPRPSRKQLKQVSVLDYRDRDDFIIELLTSKPEERMILAKVEPAATLAAIVERVLARVRSAKAEKVRPYSVLVVPKVSLHVRRLFSELQGRPIRSGTLRGELMQASQDIRFILNEYGALLRSSAYIDVAMSEDPRKPFIMEFDRPFLILLQERQGERPYFAVWIEHPEVFQEWEWEEHPEEYNLTP